MTNAERDAARMLAEVSERGDAVRDATQRNFVEMFLTLGAITLAAVVAAPFATHVDKPGAIAGVALVGTVFFGAMAAWWVRRRHNLGGRIDTSTWVAVALVFALTIAGFLLYGAPRVVAFAMLPVVGIGLGLLQRSALVCIAFGDFTITATLVASNNKKLALLAIVLLFAWSNGILALRGKVLFDK